MWLYVVVIVAVLFGWWLTRTNLYRNRSRSGRVGDEREVGMAGAREADSLNELNMNHSGLRKEPPDRPH